MPTQLIHKYSADWLIWNGPRLTTNLTSASSSSSSAAVWDCHQPTVLIIFFFFSCISVWEYWIRDYIWWTSFNRVHKIWTTCYDMYKLIKDIFDSTVALCLFLFCFFPFFSFFFTKIVHSDKTQVIEISAELNVKWCNFITFGLLISLYVMQCIMYVDCLPNHIYIYLFCTAKVTSVTENLPIEGHMNVTVYCI